MLISENKIRKIIRSVLLAENKKPEGFDTSLSKDPKIEKIIRKHAGGFRGITGNPIYQKAKGKSKNPGVSGQITSTLEKLKKKGFDLSVRDLRNGNDFSLNIDALELYFKYYNKIVKEKPKTKPKEAEKYAFRNTLNKLKIDAKIKKTDKTDKGATGAPDSDSSAGTSGSSSDSGPRKTTPKKTSSGRKSVSEIQKSLNKLKEKGFIDGDYQKKKLAVDGKWGARTRSATSKFLKLFEKEKIRSALGINKKVNDLDKLATGAKGPGSWGDVTINISGQIGVEGNKNKYDSLNALLTKFLGADGLEPVAGAGEGETESIFNAYKSARKEFKSYIKDSKDIGDKIINPGKARNSLKTEITGNFQTNPIVIDNIKFEFPYEGENQKYSIAFSFKATSNEDLNSAKVKILEISDTLKYASENFDDRKFAPEIKGKELALSDWKKFEYGRLLDPNVTKGESMGWTINGNGFSALIIYAVRIALLEKGRAANKEAGGDGSVKSFLETGKQTEAGASGSSDGGSPTSSDEKDPAVEKYGEDNLNKSLAKLTPEQRKRRSVNLLRIPAGEYKDENISLGVDDKNKFSIVKDSEKIKNHLFAYAASDKGSLIFSKQDRSGRLQYVFYYADGRLKIDGAINYQISGYVKLEDGSLVPKDAVNYFKKLSDK